MRREVVTTDTKVQRGEERKGGGEGRKEGQQSR
jgi:hypothetical protein